ncbi:hypothetical protein [Allokutzneria oryzae]|uniref:Uncharacterized protein n=1 Tax=Allokutzneria oryzae TaxID=1378989 RepID=A0ABV5ZPZ5_9PSEU
MVSGISGNAQRRVAEFERRYLYPGAVARAVDTWSMRVHGPVRALAVSEVDESCPCGCDEAAGRPALERVVRGLHGEAGHELRVIVARLDAVFVRRFGFDPALVHGREWWNHLP